MPCLSRNFAKYAAFVFLSCSRRQSFITASRTSSNLRASPERSCVTWTKCSPYADLTGPFQEPRGDA